MATTTDNAEPSEALPVSMARRLSGLIVAQFLGAFNDNAWKMIAVSLAIASATVDFDRGTVEYRSASQREMSFAQIIFTLPFLIVSFPAGVLADRFNKRAVIIGMKVFEVVLMFCGAIALVIAPTSALAPLVILALMAVHGSLFSPAKYGILPELLPHEKLSAGNGVLEMFSMLAIILGSAIGPWLMHAFGEGTIASHCLAGMTVTILAIVGLIASWQVPTVVAARAQGGLHQTVQMAWSTMRADRVLWLAVMGQVVYWTIATSIPPVISSYALGELKMADAMTGLPLAALGIGIGAGCLLAGKLSAAKVEYGLLPMGAIGLTLVTALFAAMLPGIFGTFVLMGLLGVSSGLLLVPLNALLQWRSPADCRGAVIALTNVFVFSGMLCGSGIAFVLAAAEVSTQVAMWVTALALAAGTAWSLHLVPDAFLRFLLILAANTLYRLKVIGRQNIPETGGALLVPNHVTFVDGLFVIASIDRPVRFVVDASYFERPIIGLFLRALRAIPISATGGPRMILRAFRDAGKNLDDGHLVCIFPEGQISRTGTMLTFQRGFARIVKGRAAPIVPVHLDRAFGSIFAPSRPRLIPERLPYPVTVSFGAPMPAETPIVTVRQAVQDLGCDAWREREGSARPLHRSFVRRARWHPFRLALADGMRPDLSGIGALTAMILTARQLRKPWAEQTTVGVLLPPSIPAALVNLAATLGGRTVVNLNYTAGSAGMESAMRQSGIKTVVTSRVFLDKAKIGLPSTVTPIWIEEAVEQAGLWGPLIAHLMACFLPVRVLERLAGATRAPHAADVLTVIFSSGSTGEPKGVVLTHANLDANIEAIAQVFRVLSNDRIVAVLPMFHAFGYMMFWFAANKGLGAVFHTSPLDAGVVGELVQRYEATILLTTPTILQLYRRRCTPALFGSLRLLLAGAEKLPERVAQAFEDEFGIRPLEGYGATECAPVIAVSTLDYRAPGFFQPGSRRGFVGQALPGVAVRIVDPDTFEPLPPNQPGMLCVRGPNVMQGYLGRDDLTQKVLRDGWYTTGDIALVDDDGFLKITDRLSRFSKIGGEMVPHGVVEDALHRATNAAQPIFAVTSVADAQKGEQLAVVHTLPEPRLSEVLERLNSLDLPNLFRPRPDRFVKVAELPVLGTGKIDLRAVKRIANEAFVPVTTASE